jgi:hypothetical protein
MHFILLFVSSFIFLISYLFFPYILNSSRKTINVFWTGGFDSTFRICQLLTFYPSFLIQPIYLKFPIDDSINKRVLRRNQSFELRSIQKITKQINKQFSKTASNLLPIIVFHKEIPIDKEISFIFHQLYYQEKMRRPINQYSYMMQIAKLLNTKIDVSVEYSPHESRLFQLLEPYLPFYQKLSFHKIDKYIMYFFHYFNFPTIHISKENMYQIAKNNNFSNILDMTWSCWYPINGKACQHCIMCKARIIPHN